MMRRTLFLIAAIFAMPVHGHAAATLHVAHAFADPPFVADPDACPGGLAGNLVGYVGTRRVCADALTENAREHPALAAGSVDSLVLLTSRPMTRTHYQVAPARGAVLPIANLVRRTDRRLTIRGQRGPSGEHRVWFKGLDLIDTICDPDRVFDAQACREGRPVRAAQEAADPIDRRYEMSSIAAVESARINRALEMQPTGLEAVTSKTARSYCISLSQVRGIVVEDLAFEDCWLIAVKVVNASDITLNRVRIHGSTFGMLAIATEGMEAGSHTFVVRESHWIQSPGAYRTDATTPCERPHLDLGCALDVWDDIPWGITHHHIWRPLNGALFGAYNVAGNVLVAGNTIERAYNGVRIISSLPGTGRNVEIRDNLFLFVRDNAVEPEVRADHWVVRRNVFRNVHAWISSDGVKGTGIAIFGNVGWYDADRMPGTGCSDDVAWADSPRLLGLAGDAARYELIDVRYDPTSVACRGHYRGVILKTGDNRKAGFPYLDAISIFHNSWRTRSPLFSSKHASPLAHFNNAVAFTGCGLEGPWHCRQIPAPPQYCAAGNKRTRGKVALTQFWTEDGGALYADCFSFTPGPAVPDERTAEHRAVEHTFCRDAFNRAVGAVPYVAGACQPIVIPDLFAEAARAPGALSPAVTGCAAVIKGGAVVADCSRDGAPIGAVLPDGSLYDLDIPGAGFQGPDFRP